MVAALAPELLPNLGVPLLGTGRSSMYSVFDRVMQTYGMMVNLSPTQEAEAREKLSNFLKGRDGDERVLAVEGLKHLLGHITKRRRRAVSLQDCVK
jgi:hypothetical protein